MLTTRTASPIFVAILLLLPVLYVGSYLALVQPGPDLSGFRSPDREPIQYRPYRVDGAAAQCLFWPLEQIDRKMRPESWAHYPHLRII